MHMYRYALLFRDKKLISQGIKWFLAYVKK